MKYQYMYAREPSFLLGLLFNIRKKLPMLHLKSISTREKTTALKWLKMMGYPTNTPKAIQEQRPIIGTMPLKHYRGKSAALIPVKMFINHLNRFKPGRKRRHYPRLMETRFFSCQII